MRTPSHRTTLRSGIVEDDTHVRDALYTILANARDMVLEQDWSNAKDALAEWMRQCPDVVIMNINLAGASGTNCVQQRSARSRSVQFLICTMHDDDQHVFGTLTVGANSSLHTSAKPVNILPGMRDLIHSGRPLSDLVARRAVAQLRPQRPAGAPPEAKLTEREKEILQLLAEGLLYKEISSHVGISESAVKQHIHRMYGKLHVQNRTEAVNKFFGR